MKINNKMKILLNSNKMNTKNNNKTNNKMNKQLWLKKKVNICFQKYI